VIDLSSYCVVDCETDRLPPGQMPWEIAVLRRSRDVDVWVHEVIHIIDYDEAMMTEQAASINGFRDRWLVEPGVTKMTEHNARYHLEHMLEGRTIVGSKPSFDQDALTNMGVRETWNHHYRDVPSMFLGAYGYEVKGLQGVLDALSIVNDAPHTALGDAWATARAFEQILGAVPR
jgi:DNA polymerase III subunit epsilon